VHSAVTDIQTASTNFELINILMHIALLCALNVSVSLAALTGQATICTAYKVY
jgi:hypothetical protein